MKNFEGHQSGQIMQFCKRNRRKLAESIASDIHRHFFHGPILAIVYIMLLFSSASNYYRIGDSFFLYCHAPTMLMLLVYGFYSKRNPSVIRHSLIAFEVVLMVAHFEALAMANYVSTFHPQFFKDTYVFSPALLFCASIVPSFPYKIFRDGFYLLLIYFSFRSHMKYETYHVAFLVYFNAEAMSVFIGYLLKYKFYINSLMANDTHHAYKEMSKILYKHQTDAIERGRSLEETMPTHDGKACVISFDIIGSSKIKHIKTKEFLRKVFAKCNGIMSEGYDGENLSARAYRIKEMGDGFLCSVGYPFSCLNEDPAMEAVEMAKRFAQVLEEESQAMHFESPVRCGIGIAFGSLTGFYPESGTKEYDIYGQALILASRYEGMRKIIFESDRDKSILIIQELVFSSLSPGERKEFLEKDLSEKGILVRDDPSATKLYYKFLEPYVASDSPLISSRKVG